MNTEAVIVRPSQATIERYVGIPEIYGRMEQLIEDFNVGGQNDMLKNCGQSQIDMLFATFLFGVIVALDGSSSFSKSMRAMYANPNRN